MQKNSCIRAAFVSTNSICQGEQVGTLWGEMLSRGAKINFAHRTFQWNNEARGVAAVHCIIAGFGRNEAQQKILFDYADVKCEPQIILANNINPYLVDAPDVILPSRTDTPSGLPKMTKGSQPTDGGNLIFSSEEARLFIEQQPIARKWLKPYIGAEELINGGGRMCLWLDGASPSDIKLMPGAIERLRRVAELRAKSPTRSVREFAKFPGLFTQNRQPSGDYLMLPRHSSERRVYIPIAFFTSDVIASDAALVCVDANKFHFGVMSFV